MTLPDETDQFDGRAAKQRNTKPCPRPHEMSDIELLMAGIVAKHRCSKEAGPHLVPKNEDFALQFDEIREEWKARFPNLPLSATFDAP